MERTLKSLCLIDNPQGSDSAAEETQAPASQETETAVIQESQGGSTTQEGQSQSTTTETGTGAAQEGQGQSTTQESQSQSTTPETGTDATQEGQGEPITQKSQSQSTTPETGTDATQEGQGEPITQETETAATQETQAAAPQEGDDNNGDGNGDNGDNGDNGGDGNGGDGNGGDGNGGDGNGGDGNGGDGNGGNGGDGGDDEEEEQVPWQPIDATAANFNGLLEEYGLENFVVEDVFSVEQFDTLRKNKTYGIIAAIHNPSSGPLSTQVPDAVTDNLFFRGNRPLNASATHSLLAVLANADATVGNVVLSDNIRDYILKDDTKANDRFLKEIQNSLPALPVANLDPEEVFEEQDINNQTGDLYRYIAYVPYGDSIWQFESERQYPIRRSRITPGVHWINTLQRWIAAEIGSHPFGTTFLAVSENPKVVVGEKYDAIHEFHERIVDRFDTGTRFARNAGEVLTQLHLNRVQTSMIGHLRNLVNTDLGDRAVEFLGQYGLGLEEEEASQAASQAVRGRKTRGRPRSIRGTRRKVASQSTGGRGGSQTGSRKRQRDTDGETELQRKERVKTIYGLRK